MAVGVGISRAIGRNLIKALLPTGMSGRAIERELFRLGYSYRRTEMLKDIRTFTGRAKYEEAIRSLGPGELVPRRFMPDEELKRGVKYQVFGEATYYDPQTDSYTFEDGSFYTDRYATKEEMEEDFCEKMVGKYDAARKQAVGFDVRGVSHNKGYDY